MRLNSLLGIFLLFICASGGHCAEYKQERYLMGTLAKITLFAGSEKQADEAFEAAFIEMSRVDQMMSNWKDDSELMEMNRRAYAREFKVSPELFTVLQASLKYSRLSGGAFDVTVGPLVRLWGFIGGEKKVPDPDEIRKLLASTGYQKVILDANSRTVRFKHPDLYVDLGGIAKGYAVDRAVAALKQHGIKRALVDLGRNIYVLEMEPDGPSWEVGVQHPRKEQGFIRVLRLKNQAVATSGDYEKFFVENGKRYSHILDPRTGYPAEGCVSATVVAPTAMASDALSTAVFVMGPSKGKAMLKGIPGTSCITFGEEWLTR